MIAVNITADIVNPIDLTGQSAGPSEGRGN
jgi:hypothetical protein